MSTKVKPPKNAARPQKAWIKYCIYGAIALLLLAGVLYAVRYIGLDMEFNHNKEYFGEKTYGEIFALEDSKDQAKPIMELAEQAFSFIGTQAEAQERFGLLSRYSGTEAQAASQSFTLDYIISDLSEKEGYVWVAYTQECYDAGGALLSSSGTQKDRILSRWSVEKQEGQWVVTEIREKP